jgi:hypothetical protein
MDPTENTVSHLCGCMFTAALPGNRLPISPCFCSARAAEKIYSFPSTVASIRIYIAVAWQRLDEIRYNIFKCRLKVEIVEMPITK